MNQIRKSKERCPQCKLQVPVCMCAEIPQLQTKTKLIVIIHASEIHKPTNTGSLAARCLANSELHVRGVLNQPTIDTSGFVEDGRASLVLFPDENAVELTSEYVASLGKPVNLIVPDGNWKQANSIPKREPILRTLPRVILPAGDLSEYRLRREARQRPEGLGTMEAIARAMRILEGDEIYEQLMHVFRIKVARSLWIRGRLRSAEVYGGLPQAD